MNSPIHARIRRFALLALLTIVWRGDSTEAAIAPGEVVDPGTTEGRTWTRIDEPVPPVGSRILLEAASRLLVAFPDRTDEVWTRPLEETGRWRRIPVRPPYFDTIGGDELAWPELANVPPGI